MMKMKIVFLYLVNTGIALGRLVEGPRNAVVIVGQRMEMTCKTEGVSRVRKWSHLNTRFEISTIYSNSSGVVSGHYGVDVNEYGSGLLYTNATKLNDSGIYICEAEIEGKDHYLSAALVVLESEPFCETNWTADINQFLAEDETIWIRCSVFREFLEPKMQWRQHWTNEQKLIDRHVIPTCSDTNCSSELVVILNSTDEGSFFSCYVYFDQYGNRENLNATNVPWFNYTWTSDVIRLRKRNRITVSSNETSSMQLYFFGFSGLFIFLIIVIVVYGVRRRGKLLASRKEHEPDTVISASERIDRQNPDAHNLMPHAPDDQYEDIEDIGREINVTYANQVQLGTMPTSEYSGLIFAEPMPPSVYERLRRDS